MLRSCCKPHLRSSEAASESLPDLPPLLSRAAAAYACSPQPAENVQAWFTGPGRPATLALMGSACFAAETKLFKSQAQVCPHACRRSPPMGFLPRSSVAAVEQSSSLQNHGGVSGRSYRIPSPCSSAPSSPKYFRKPQKLHAKGKKKTKTQKTKNAKHETPCASILAEALA